MEWMDQIWQLIIGYIDGMYLLTFMLLSYLIKRYFREWLCTVLKVDVKTVYIVLILATLVAIPFLIMGAEWQKILFSYTLGTSMHETCFKFFEDKINPAVK